MLIVYIFFILYCHRQARLCGALLGTSPHTVSSDFSLWGRGVSVCFLCGSLCGLLLAALCGPVLWSAFGPPSSVGRFPFIILSATFILCMSSTASAVVLSHMVPTWSGPEPSGPGLHDDVDHAPLHAPVVLAHVHRPAQPRSWAAVVAGSAPARLDPPLSGAAASATAGADHDTQGAALLADPLLSGAAASSGKRHCGR